MLARLSPSWVLASLGFFLYPSMPFAAMAQDAGATQRSLQEQQLRSLLRQQRLQLNIDGEHQPIPFQPDASFKDPRSSLPDNKIVIKHVEVIGEEFLSTGDHLFLDSKYIFKPATASTLNRLRLDLESFLTSSSLLGYVYQPHVGLDGTVSVEVLIARLDAVRVVENKSRLSSLWAVNTVLDSVRIGSQVRLDKVSSALLKLNDLAGIRASAIFRPGTSQGGTDLILKLLPDKQKNLEVGFNNYTIENTGPYQFQVDQALQNLLGRGEKFEIGGEISGNGYSYGSRLGYVNVNYPLTPGGLQALASYYWTDYRELGDYYSYGSKGTFQTVSAGLRQVLLRRPDRSLYAQLIGEFDKAGDSELGYQYSDYNNSIARLSFDGSTQKDAFGGLFSSSSFLAFSGGRVSSNSAIVSPYYASFDSNPGWWGKVFSLSDNYYSFPDQRFSLEALAQAQAGFGNLDSYEAISLGWPNAVRAYSPGSNLGNSGITLQSTVRYQLFPKLSLRAYVDVGRVWNSSTGSSGTASPGSYGLWGPGLGLDLGSRGNLLLSVDVAFQGSKVPGDSGGVNSYPAQLWLSVKKWL